MNAPVQFRAASAERPFPGLRPFAYADHAYFFGRDDQKFALYRLIDRSRFVTVVGSSGSGKSSLVRAGLLPLLDMETGETGGRNWLWREMRPGDAPLQELAKLLAGLSIGDDAAVASGRRERIAAQLQRSSFGISEALAETKGISDKTLVIVVDQFEELFRFAVAGPARAGLTADGARARDDAAKFVQLLLEASRTPLHKINIILTMRSDFIGDCARFHGLPEAICAAQFLVPSLTRDQLDDVIRLPVKEAGATIDPELIERLLNDCGTELDQLPVLQHCLSRLWEEAGKTPVQTPSPPLAPPGKQDSDGAPAGRHLSLIHYRNIGEFSDALSRHADEILKDLGPDLGLAVTQVFSALSELDKEGRAIRRALKFSQLVAETGIGEADLRRVLDRFRTDDCSFITPPRFDVNWIDNETRIDVGHEALLRRWEQVCGHGIEPGWLRAEQQAGERYRGLLAMAESGATLPSHLVDERLAWWNARPRTAAWAARYGGGFDRVVRLLETSRWWHRAKQLGIAAAFAAVVILAVVMGSLWQNAQHAKELADNARVQADQARRLADQARVQADESRKNAVIARAEADKNRKEALEAIAKSVERLGGYVNDGTLMSRGAEQLLKDAQATLESLAADRNKPLDISKIEVALLLSFSDVRNALGEYDKALEHAKSALEISEALLRQYPDNQDVMRLIYAASFRIGDQEVKRDSATAERHFETALAHAKKRVQLEPDYLQRQRDVTFVLNKLADIYKARRNWKAALENYEFGLKLAEGMADKFPIETATQKNRIGQLLSERGEPGDAQEALARYREALAIITGLPRASEDATLLSNAALTHRRIGGLLKDNPAEARAAYEAAVEKRKKLFESDPGNVAWRTGLATDQKLLGDVLKDLKEFRAAFQNYGAAAQIEEGLVNRDPTNVVWQRMLAETNVRRGDIAVVRGNEAVTRREPIVVDEQTRRFADALVRYQTAAAVFEKFLDDPKAGPTRFANLFDVRIKIGDVKARQNKYGEALASYQSALAVAPAAALTTRRFAEWHIRAADMIAQACDYLAREAAGGPAGAVLASSDQPDALSCYQKASAAIEAAAEKEPDNPAVKERKGTLTARIEALQAAAK